ncbi:hypothetical protein [Microvirga tunisiensis]|uniref:Uncharacterized protein n=1 Tax=Microvirga tunisiensis TaxID=2108360 RepID=A0A5N7MVV5_9HYPH|nr:hypothetical protein [Microvirga tunisiensis]MPR12891.1 hypothetical protein [Microvirga tunisiensis]MPR30810.1 hypothetical protein [Microvirga tunisiensis]
MTTPKVKLVDMYAPPTSRQKRDTSDTSQQQALAEMLLKGNQPTQVYSNTAGMLDVGSKLMGALLAKRATSQEKEADEQAWSDIQNALASQSLGLDDAPSSSDASSVPPSGQSQPSRGSAAPSVAPRPSGDASQANATNERQRAAEAQADGLKPWEKAKREQETAQQKPSSMPSEDEFPEDAEKPWEAAKRQEVEGLDLARARARARAAMRAREHKDTKAREVRVQAEFEAMSPLHKAGRATMDIARLGLDGASFGFGDKLLAGIEAAGRSDMDYDEALQLHRQATGDAKARAGYAGTAAEIGGALLPMGAAAKAGVTAARLIPQSLSRAKTLGARLIAGGAEGAGYGALHGAGHDQNVGDAALLGAAAGAGGTAAAQAVGGVTHRLAQALKKKPSVPSTEELTAQAQAAEGAASLKEALGLRGRVAKSDAVERALREAELAANPERATRTLVGRLPQTMDNLTPDELAAVRDVAKGSLSRKATRLTGDLLAPQGPLGGASVGGAVSGLLAGHPWAIAAPLTGAGAKVLSDRLTKRKANQLAELMRAGRTREALTGPDNALQRLAKSKTDALARALLSGELSLAPYAINQD